MKRSIGAAGAAAALIGFVIGGGLFVLPDKIAQSAGPGVLLSFAIAGTVALLFCFVAAQVGCIFPVSGASFVAVSRILSPGTGFCMMWMLLFALPLAAAMLAYTFADYFLSFFPALDRKMVALSLVASLGFLNLRGAMAAVNLQTFMVAIMLLVLLIFCFGGFQRFDVTAFIPLAPHGWTSIVMGAVPAFFAFVGFVLILEIGGEIKNPSINIPIALFASFAIVLLVYCAVTVALINIIPWEHLNETPAALARAAHMALPEFMSPLIGLAALAATATTVNGIMLMYSREMFALARARVFPAVFAVLSKRHGEPLYGVLTITTLSLLAVAAGGNIMQYANAAVAAIMFQQLCLALVIVVLPTRMPEEFRESDFKLPAMWRYFFAATTMTSSLAFIALSLSSSAEIRTAVLGALVIGVIAYVARAKSLERSGVDVRQLMSTQMAERVRSTSAPH